jgi:hypothetical protein
MLEKTRREPTDRVVGVLRVLLILIGIAAMGTVMWMTGRFGWSLQEADADRWASAVLHVLGDAAGAGLVAIAGIMLGWVGWRWKLMGSIAMLCALVLVAYSIVSVYGFMSTRIAHLESHKAVVSVDQGALDWSRKTSVSKEVPKGERMLMRKDVKERTEQLKKSLSFIPDAQAAGVAAWFGTTTEKVQRGLVVITSCVGQLIKVSCLFFGFSLWAYRADNQLSGRDEGGGNNEKPKLSLVKPTTTQPEPLSAAATQLSSVVQKQRSDASVPGIAPKWSRDRLDDFLHNGGKGLTQQSIARLSGYTQQGVSQAQRRLHKREQREASRRLEAALTASPQPAYYPNFGGRTHAPAGI